MQSFSASRSRALTAAGNRKYIVFRKDDDSHKANVNELLERVLQLLQKIQIFRKIHHMSVLSLQQHAGGDLTGVHRIEAVLDLLTERLYLVTGGRVRIC